MPSDEEIAQAFWGVLRSQLDWRGSDIQIRALIRTAVERALAEQEARHKREVLEAQIAALVRADSRVQSYGVHGIDNYLKDLRRKLAALEAKP